MFSLRRSAAMLLAVLTTVVFHSLAQAADPGLPLPADGVMNDQKPGSVLVFNSYSSGATSGTSQNTRIAITNTNPTEPVFVRFYFATDQLGPEAIISTFICLAPNQTVAFLTSDFDPGVTGFLIAVAVHPQLECPVGFNYLTGRADIKFTAGYQATLEAQTIAALFTGVMPGCQSGTGSATLLFNGSSNGYDRLPRTLVIDRLFSPAEGNDALLFINRLGGSTSRFTDRIGLLVGTLYDDAGNSFDFTRDIALRQYRSSVSALYSSNLGSALPAGRKGWMKFSATQSNDFALFGAVVNLNANSQASRTVFSGGQNLRALTFTGGVTLTISMRPPSC
ncbi:MAG TPA: hypothetical protein PLD20_18320 [Blastocatellia bacterium]|nr:hypothetical protein [Blastocatellia bacterium]HMV85972.1 hypothetical protein [Blastocatellia bacterium]HMX27167.1 hypothetical protein [Blastocatellia bacterium]HMY72830.1 hypothetical protein [Blastocatellia bacterium]HMZ19898.1 hypothetical protein [Blastocatellia bacterium]